MGWLVLAGACSRLAPLGPQLLPRGVHGLAGSRDEWRDVDHPCVPFHDSVEVRPHERVKEMVYERDQMPTDVESLRDLLRLGLVRP